MKFYSSPALLQVPGSRRAFSLIVLACLLLFAFCLSGCRSGTRDRPHGYIRLGLVRDLVRPVTYFDRSAFILRFDGKGFSVMSTLSTRDLTRLARKDSAEGPRWYSENDESVFADDGTVLQGPASEDLPYYEIVLDEGTFRGPKDTLYVQVGSKRAKDWRFELPPELLLPQEVPVEAVQGNAVTDAP